MVKGAISRKNGNFASGSQEILPSRSGHAEFHESCFNWESAAPPHEMTSSMASRTVLALFSSSACSWSFRGRGIEVITPSHPIRQGTMCNVCIQNEDPTFPTFQDSDRRFESDEHEIENDEQGLYRPGVDSHLFSELLLQPDLVPLRSHCCGGVR
jgi:hypothetical protein